MTPAAKKPRGQGDAARDAHESWRDAYDRQIETGPARRNRSGVEIAPLYTPDDWDGARYQEDLGFPGHPPGTRGTYTTMYRGRPWSRRQIVGFGLPEDYNRRQRAFIDAGVTGIYLAPCNSYMRGYDIDQVDPAVLGTCGTLINTVDDMDRCLAGIELADAGLSLGDNPPFTLSAMVLAVARQRGTDWSALAGTTNQSDYLSHYVANHMFFRVALPGSRRLLLDHMDFMARHCPRWNPLSVVGQHMQQAGANPAEAMAFTLASALQYAEDLVAAGHEVDDFLPRFSFFFDISMSFFEEIAKFRAGRRLWMRLARERLGAKDPKSWRFRFHGQTSGVDLTRQQPLNNIARVAIQAMAGIFGGLQSLHTDAYDEALSSPTEDAARVALATQNILHDEAHLGDVIDPLGGSYYVESLTNELEARIEAVLDKIDAAGGMYRAVEDGLVQRMIGDSARAFQERLEGGEETIVGVTAYALPDDAAERPAPLERLSPEAIEGQLARLKSFKEGRNQAETRRAMDRLARAAGADDGENIYECVVEAIAAGATHGEVCARVREIMGFGQPLIAA